MSDTSAEPPVDPNAPTVHTLPSGKVVSVRSPRTLLGSHVRTTMSSQGAGGMQGVVESHSVLIALTVTELEAGRAGTPVLLEAAPPDGTLEVAQAYQGALVAVDAQRGDDYRTLYRLMDPAWRVCVGLDNITDDYEAFEDPKADTSQALEQPPS